MNRRRRRGIAGVLLLAALLAPGAALARVVRVTIDRREPISGAFGAAGAYERITGRVYFAFDPANPRDKRIVDLDQAPRNAAGEVEAWSEFVMLVPRADSVGNEIGGIQSVELRVPLGTYLPWQLRTMPPTDRLVSFQGTFVPFQRVEADRVGIGDGRPSLEKLYPSRTGFLAAVDRATSTLVSQRFLLPEDRAVARQRMERTWDWVNTH